MSPEFHTQEIVYSQIGRGGQEATFLKSAPCSGSLFSIIDELQMFDFQDMVKKKTVTLYGTTSLIGTHINWSDSKNRVNSTTTSVMTLSGSAYTPGVDYTITDLGVITSLLIPDRTIIRVTYDWAQPCIDLKTGVPNLNCETCGGWGAIYPYPPVPVIGLFHIPSYDDKLVIQGLWRAGDATFTTTSFLDITTRWLQDRFWGKDKIVMQKISGDIYNPTIRNQDWYIVSPPQSIQIHNSFLAFRHHLRMRTQDGD